MIAMASEITSVLIVLLAVCSDGDQRKHQSSASLAFVRGIHRWPVDSAHKGPVTQKNPFDDVVMEIPEIWQDMRCREIQAWSVIYLSQSSAIWNTVLFWVITGPECNNQVMFDIVLVYIITLIHVIAFLVCTACVQIVENGFSCTFGRI